MDGLVLSRDVEVGDAVSSILVLGSQATLVMTLGDVSEVYVLGKVDEADIGKVYLGQRGAHRGRVVQGPEVRGQGHEDLALWARRRTTSPLSRCESPSRTPAAS